MRFATQGVLIISFAQRSSANALGANATIAVLHLVIASIYFFHL